MDATNLLQPSWLLVNLVGIASNLDNTGVGVAYGAAGVRFPHRVNLVVNAIGLGAAALGAYAADRVEQLVSPSTAQFVACAILCAVGTWMLLSRGFRPVSTSQVAGPLKLQDGILLGLALSFTNLASSAGAALANHGATWRIIFSIAVWGYLLIWAGNRLSRRVLARWLGEWGVIVAGTLLIGIGLKQLAP
ncbi:MAG: manganese efflux pump [Thermoflavifilum sp.]|nr:manganese efflux pump [Thermoflavifilum sp.]MCL6514292.1 manganese efflux pump [Alicyclobacillus sp.]